MTDRLDALETRIAYQDETIEALNATVTRQWAEIDALRRQLERLRDQVEQAASAPGAPEPPPPHY